MTMVVSPIGGTVLAGVGVASTGGGSVEGGPPGLPRSPADPGHGVSAVTQGESG